MGLGGAEAPKLNVSPHPKQSLPILYYQKVHRIKLLIFTDTVKVHKNALFHTKYLQNSLGMGYAHPQTQPLLGRGTHPPQTLPYDASTPLLRYGLYTFSDLVLAPAMA